MTVAEFIVVLERFDSNAQIVVTWEGTVHELSAAVVFRGADGDVYIDAEEGFVRQSIISGKNNKYSDKEHWMAGCSTSCDGMIYGPFDSCPCECPCHTQTRREAQED